MLYRKYIYKYTIFTSKNYLFSNYLHFFMLEIKSLGFENYRASLWDILLTHTLMPDIRPYPFLVLWSNHNRQ